MIDKEQLQKDFLKVVAVTRTRGAAYKALGISGMHYKRALKDSTGTYSTFLEILDLKIKEFLENRKKPPVANEPNTNYNGKNQGEEEVSLKELQVYNENRLIRLEGIVSAIVLFLAGDGSQESKIQLLASLKLEKFDAATNAVIESFELPTDKVNTKKKKRDKTDQEHPPPPDEI